METNVEEQTRPLSTFSDNLQFGMKTHGLHNENASSAVGNSDIDAAKPQQIKRHPRSGPVEEEVQSSSLPLTRDCDTEEVRKYNCLHC